MRAADVAGAYQLCRATLERTCDAKVSAAPTPSSCATEPSTRLRSRTPLGRIARVVIACRLCVSALWWNLSRVRFRPTAPAVRAASSGLPLSSAVFEGEGWAPRAQESVVCIETATALGALFWLVLSRVE